MIKKKLFENLLWIFFNSADSHYKAVRGVRSQRLVYSITKPNLQKLASASDLCFCKLQRNIVPNFIKIKQFVQFVMYCVIGLCCMTEHPTKLQLIMVLKCTFRVKNLKSTNCCQLQHCVPATQSFLNVNCLSCPFNLNTFTYH